jgi:hypothetical protein
MNVTIRIFFHFSLFEPCFVREYPISLVLMKVKVKRSIRIHMKASSFRDGTVTTYSVKIGMTRYEVRPTKLHRVTVMVKECVPFRYPVLMAGNLEGNIVHLVVVTNEFRNNYG